MKKLTKAQRQTAIEALRPTFEALAGHLLRSLRTLLDEQNDLVAERKTWYNTNALVSWRASDERLCVVNAEIDLVHEAIHQVQMKVYGHLI